MKKNNLLLLQYRSDQSTQHERKCFEDALAPNVLSFANVIELSQRTGIIPLAKYSGIILGASGQLRITQPDALLTSLLKTSQKIIDRAQTEQIPILGIALGHQLLTKHFKGDVFSGDSHTGVAEIKLTTEGKEHFLFKDMPSKFYGVAAHKDAIQNLPPGAVVLATSSYHPFQAVAYNDSVFSMQFQPELSKEDLEYRLHLYPEYLGNKKSFGNGHSMEHVKKILHNFAEFCADKE